MASAASGTSSANKKSRFFVDSLNRASKAIVGIFFGWNNPILTGRASFAPAFWRGLCLVLPLPRSRPGVFVSAAHCRLQARRYPASHFSRNKTSGGMALITSPVGISVIADSSRCLCAMRYCKRVDFNSPNRRPDGRGSEAPQPV
jgi:hypothetical protein